MALFGTFDPDAAALIAVVLAAGHALVAAISSRLATIRPLAT